MKDQTPTNALRRDTKWSAPRQWHNASSQWHRFVTCVSAFIILLIATSPAHPIAHRQESDQTPHPTQTSEPPDTRIHIAHLTYGSNYQTSICFSSGYLHLLNRETNIRIDPDPIKIELESDQLYEYPFSILSGEGEFFFTEVQTDALRDYLESGGFILASAGCSNAQWAESFEREIKRLASDEKQIKLEPLPEDHDIYNLIYKVTAYRSSRSHDDPILYGLELDGRLALVYSPDGLNDSGNAGGGCCCCGGHEIRNSKYLNANILAYALQN